jgi:hypothetical protein
MIEFNLTRSQRLQLVQILNSRGGVDSETARRNFLFNSYSDTLPHLPSQIPISGATDEFSKSLIRELLTQGRLPNSRRHALVPLLHYLRPLVSGWEFEVAFIEELLDSLELWSEQVRSALIPGTTPASKSQQDVASPAAIERSPVAPVVRNTPLLLGGIIGGVVLLLLYLIVQNQLIPLLPPGATGGETPISSVPTPTLSPTVGFEDSIQQTTPTATSEPTPTPTPTETVNPPATEVFIAPTQTPPPSHTPIPPPPPTSTPQPVTTIIIVNAHSESGVRFTAPRNDTYIFRYLSGAYMSDGTDETRWASAVYLFQPDVRWGANVYEANEGKMPDRDFAVGTLGVPIIPQDSPYSDSAAAAEARAKNGIHLLPLHLEAGTTIVLIAIDSQGNYGDNIGSVEVEVQY